MSHDLDKALFNSFKTQRIDQKLMIVSAFALPFMQQLSIICWILAAVIALIFFLKEKRKIQFSISFPTILLPLLYLLLAAGLLWSSNLKMGGKIMEEKDAIISSQRFIINTLISGQKSQLGKLKVSQELLHVSHGRISKLDSKIVKLAPSANIFANTRRA